MEAKKGKPHSPFHLWAQVSKIILLGVIVLTCIFALNQFKLSRSFPIRSVRVYGINRVAQQEVQDALTPLVEHGFFSVNVENIRERLLQVSWVSDLYVRRVWPDQVDITLVEKNAIARWNDESLLTDTGEVFSPRQETYPQHLPQLIGPDGQQIVMLGYFKDINRLLAPLHAKISYLELTPFLTWKLTLDNGITMQIGHKDILTRLSHFVRVYPKIVGDRAADVEYIDLRYPNGMAVRWKETVKA